GSETAGTEVDAAAQAQFANGASPALTARKRIAEDFQILAPVDPTYTLPSGWTGMNGDATTASSRDATADPALLALYDAARATVRGVGHDSLVNPSVGSNNWVVGPSRSAAGHVRAANEPHPALSKAAIR